VSHELRTSDPSRGAPAGPVSPSDDPLAPARARGERAKRELLAAQGEMLDAAEVADRLGLTTAAVEGRRKRGLLLALPLDDGSWAFPAWQFAGHDLLPGLEDALRDLGVNSPWSRVAFFLSGDLRLDGQTPLAILMQGDIDAVRDAAAYGVQVPA
jgi:hypothetical protein